MATVGLTLFSSVAGEPPKEPDSFDWNQARQFWSFQRPRPQTLPSVRNVPWPRQRLDYFILSDLENHQLHPSGEANPRVLARRLTYTLTGLPPTPEEMERFLEDTHPGAYERLVDRLLESPRFGEHVASLWLNLARYGEDQAHQVGNDTKHFYPNAYVYRQWVIDAFNHDLPYDQFLKLQLAADQYTQDDTNQLPALGFLGLGPKYYNRGRLEVMADEWEDRVDTVCRTTQGLTVACARCHDHKFDPIKMEDYYALAGVFASTTMLNRPWQALQPEESEESEKSEASDKKGKEKKNDPDPKTTMHIVAEGEAKNLHVFLRGNVDNPGPEEIPRRFLRVLCADEPQAFQEGSGRRELAETIASPENPLTARVMVNRIWGLVFGKALVGTPSNFGHLGDRPTHPALLDDLAVRFMEQDWSVKRLVREMVLSATFRQASHSDPIKADIDPANRWWWRMNRQRMTVEMWRDSLLFVSDRLEPTGGASLELDDPHNQRRTVYARISRLKLNDVLMQFDYPDANVHNAKRSVTITPMQKLFVLNSPFMWNQAEGLATRLLENEEGDDTGRIAAAYQLLYGRPPTGEETRLGLDFLKENRAESAGAPAPWVLYAQALLAANEMMYVD